MAIGGDRDKGLAVAQEELVVPRIGAVQAAEAILPPCHLQERLDDPVDEELVAEEAVVVEGVEGEEAVLVESLVLEDQRDVELPELVAARERHHPAGESKCSRARVQLTRDRVDPVEVEEETGEAAIDVHSGDVDRVVVVPERRVLVLLLQVVRLVRVEVVSRLSRAERIERIAVVLRELEAAVTMDGGDGLTDAHGVVRRQVVHEAHEGRGAAAGEERRPRRHAVVAPDDVRRQRGVEGMRRGPLVNQEELRVGRDGARTGHVKRRRPVHVHAVARIGAGRKRRDGFRERRDR